MEGTESNEIRYILENQGYILNQDDIGTDLRDLLCTDGSRAILVDGQYLVTDSSAILLREGDDNFARFYVNDDESYAVDADGAKCVQLVEQDDSSQIIYYMSESDGGVQELAEDDVERIQDADGNIYPFKRIKLEGQLLNLEEFVQSQESAESARENVVVEYALVQNEGDSLEAVPMENELFDLSQITGRNLITGQTVTLHSYMEKLKNRLKTPEKRGSKKTEAAKRRELNRLIHKKISIGKTKSGKNIVAKIIHVDKKRSVEPENDEEEEEECNDNEPDVNDKEEDDVKILVKTSTVSKENFEQISKTLGGVMEMVSVRKKLENKNLVVKLVEKKYCGESDSMIKTTSYSYGYMEKEGDLHGDVWKFTPDQDTQEALLSEHFKDESAEKKSTKFPITTSLTIVISYAKTGERSIRVNLNPAAGNLCTICAQYFKSNLQLRIHMHVAHNTYGISLACEVCGKVFDSKEKLKVHRDVHLEEGKLFVCPTCNKSFVSHSKFQKHVPTHDTHLSALECGLCQKKCANVASFKKHLETHTGVKVYPCEVCGKQFVSVCRLNFHKRTHFPEKQFECNVCLRSFSRHSNLLRHAEIHGGTDSLYKCEVCNCSYNFSSSLTRHMVQNHMGDTEARKRPQPETE